MKQKLIGALVALLITLVGIWVMMPSAYAQTSAANVANVSSLDISKLTPEQKAALISQATALEKETKSPTNISQTVRSEAAAWGELGANLGRATVAAAKEVGIAANEFVATPLGKITMGIVIYKIIGNDLISIIVGCGVMFFFWSVALYMILKNKYASAEFANAPILWGLTTKRRVTSFVVDDDLLYSHWIAAGIMIVIGLIVGLSVIF